MKRFLVGNITNGERFETYCIPAPADSGTIALNGAAAHKGKVGDLLVILTFIELNPEEAAAWEPRLVIIEDTNTTFKKILLVKLNNCMIDYKLHIPGPVNVSDQTYKSNVHSSYGTQKCRFC